MAYATVRGCRDVFSTAAASRRHLISRFAQLCETYAFTEVDTPILEYSSVFSRALGSTSDIVSSELFHIVSRRNSIVLRPEGTASVLRAVAAAGGARALGVHGCRLWYVGPMFRHERPQHLRLRQFTQLGVEIVQDDSITADVDVISLAAAFLRESPRGCTAKLKINSLGSLGDRERYNEALIEYLTPPRLGALSELSRARVAAGQCLRVLDSKLAEDIDVMRGAPPLANFVGKCETKRFDEVQRRLDEEGVPFMVDSTLVRGLDYYTSTAFEFVDNDGRAVAAGGRYNNVHELSGVGFAVGLERVEDPQWIDCDKSRAESLNIDIAHGVAVLPITDSCGAEPAESKVGSMVRQIARELRALGIRTIARLEKGRIGKQISRSIKSGARAIVIVGENDVAKGFVKVKIVNHVSRDAEYEQLDVALEDVAQFCRSLGDKRATDPFPEKATALEVESVDPTHIA